MKTILRVGLVLTGLFGAVALRAADEPSPHSAELREFLAKNGFELQEIDGGDFATSIKLGNGRTQFVYVKSAVDEVKSLKIREVWSIALQAEEKFSEDQLRQFMRDAGFRPLTAWKLMAIDGKETLVCYAKLPLSIPPEEFFISMGLVTGVADTVERELTEGKDTF